MSFSTPTLTLATLLALAPFGRTQDATPLCGIPHGEAASSNHGEIEALQLHLVQGEPQTWIELRGGQPGRTALLVFGSAHLDGSTAMHGLVRPEAMATGCFDATGSFRTPVQGQPAPGRPVSCQGFEIALDAFAGLSWKASAGLDIEPISCIPVPVPVPTGTVGIHDIRSLLRFEVGPDAMPALTRELGERDLAGALAAALNSAGDSLSIKVGGKLMLPIPTPPPIKLGGSVSVSVVAGRSDSAYTLTVAADVALLCGVKVPKFDVGVEAGKGLSVSTVYEFATVQEAADGIIDLALLTAVGHKGASEAHVRVAGMARQAWAAYAEVQQRFAHAVRLPARLRVPAVERALSRLRAARARRYSAIARGLEIAEQIVRRLNEARSFLRTHQMAYGLGFTTMAKACLKVEQEGVFEIGGELSGARKISVSIVRREGRRIERIELAAESVTELELAAAATLGAEASCTRTFGVWTSFVRDAGGRLAHEATRFGIKSETELSLIEKTLVDVKAGIGRETSVSFDACEFGAAHVEAFRALAAGETGGLAALAGIHARIEVQDRIVRRLERELQATADIKLSAELGWSDKGTQRRLELSANDILESLLDVEARAREVGDLVTEAKATLLSL